MKKISLYMVMLAGLAVSACQGNRNNDADRTNDAMDQESPYMENEPLDTMRRDSLDTLGTPMSPTPVTPMN